MTQPIYTPEQMAEAVRRSKHPEVHTASTYVLTVANNKKLEAAAKFIERSAEALKANVAAHLAAKRVSGKMAREGSVSAEEASAVDKMLDAAFDKAHALALQNQDE